jgi:transcriptional regulator with XRE-family HTH domain
MKRKQENKEIQPIVDRIHFATRDRGWTLRETAQEIGISHVHLTSLTSGARKISGLSIEKQRKLAKFIGVNMLDFYLLCGVLRQEDLVQQA